MENENEELFNQVEEEELTETLEEKKNEEPLLPDEDFKPVVNTKSLKEVEDEKGVKVKMDGATLTVKSVEIMPPKTYTLKDGNREQLPPIVSPNTGVKYYSSKLKIRYEEDNLVEYLPGLNYFFNRNGTINPKVSLNRSGDNQVSNLVRKVLIKMAADKGIVIGTKKTKNGQGIADKDLKIFSEFSKSVSDQAVLDYLVGKKVVIETEEGVYLGKPWFRNNIKEIL